MKKTLRAMLIVPLAAVVMLAAAPRGSAGQTVVVTPTRPPAEKPTEPQKPDPAKPDPAKPAEKPAQPAAVPPAPVTPPRPTTPDQTAYSATLKIKDPAEKIAALEKFLKDFPESQAKTGAVYALFETYVANRQAERTAILGYAQRYIDAGPEGFKATGYSRVANALLTANLFLDDAASLAERGLAVFDEEETKRVGQSRASHLATLGRIRLKQGRVKDAEKALKAAFAANPEIPAAVIGLAELADSKKDHKAAADYWLRAALTGRLAKAEREKFEASYRASNDGSLDGLEAAMDAKYRATTTSPVHPVAYKPTPDRTDRVVLAEVFTGAGCPPCVAADLAFDSAMERYTHKDLAVVMYHLHIPLPDPLTNKATLERAKYYGVTGVPTAAIEGATTVGGGARSNTKMVYDRIVGQIDRALEVAPTAKLDVAAAVGGGNVRVKATPSALAPEGEAVKLQILLVEQMLSYSGENGVRFHPMVVRSMAGDNYSGFTVDRKAAAAVEHTFDLAKIAQDTLTYIDGYEKERVATQPAFSFSRKPVDMRSNNLSVVVFLQEEKSKKILQATYVRLDPSTTTTASR
jgi:tetratricopeptide (TPR) repeat protein